MASLASKRRNLVVAIGFLLPNILGVLTFVVFPVIFSIFMAFSNWDLKKHNLEVFEPLEFVGLGNFVRLLTEADFLRYFGNTLFLMIAIPFSVAGSLLAAILLSKDTRGGGGRVGVWLLAGTGLVVSVAMLTVLGLGATGMTILLVGVACGVLILGMVGGRTAYRTFFYTPHFVAGVATFLLWKKLYNPTSGPINAALRPVLNAVESTVNALGPGVTMVRWVLLGLVGLLVALALHRVRRWWTEGDLGSGAIVVPVGFLLLPAVLAGFWSYIQAEAIWLGAFVAAVLIVEAVLMVRQKREMMPPSAGEGFGNALMLALALLVLQLILVGLAAVTKSLPAMVADGGLAPPNWLASYHWAKPALMITLIWAAIGSNNMLLYLAALTNIPQDLYEASDIDGAGRFQKFWHVTWPQLAPTTFFIAVMSTIYGLQGGFEMARTMTEGGPAGATTVLSYFIYLEGFETGRLSMAAATGWALFLLVFILTMINWKFGNRYVND